MSINIKMSSAPVFYTLAQVRFNPIEQMIDYIPKIQDTLRRSAYPDFTKENLKTFSIQVSDKTPPEIQERPMIRWSFFNTQRTEGYLLLSDTLTFQTTNYETFQDLLKKFLDGLKLIHQIVELAFIERIGLRYLDAIVPSTTHNIEDYLHRSLLGLSSIINGSLVQSLSETLMEIDEGTLIARTVITDKGQLPLPPDLTPLQLNIPEKLSKLTGKTAILDNDYFTIKRFNFDITKIQNQLEKSHDILSKTFKTSITNHALNEWK